MDLRKVSDETLVRQTEDLVKKEREVLADLLRHLHENERRRLFSSLGFKSLFEYTTKRLGYPEDQAWRRIKAMQLMKELPEIEQKIESGEITLSHISIARNLFRQEEAHDRKFTPKEKLEVFESLANTTTREAQKEIIKFSTATEVIFDRFRHIGEETVEIRFPAPIALEEKLQKLKGLLAHVEPNMTLAKLIDRLCDLGFQEWDPAAKGFHKKTAAKKIAAAGHRPIETNKLSRPFQDETSKNNQTRDNKFIPSGESSLREAERLALQSAKPLDFDKFESQGEGPERLDLGDGDLEKSPTKNTVMISDLQRAAAGRKNFDAPSPAAPRVTPRQVIAHTNSKSRTISPQLKREIWIRDRGRCSKCGSTYALQVDHCEPHAHGGDTVSENLRLLCRNCNQRYAIESFGAEKMENFMT